MGQARCATLHIDLGAVCANYRLLRQCHAQHAVAAVVKADAYGLGARVVAHALWSTGCRSFFVATLDEAVDLRQALPDATIAVFNGIFEGEESEYIGQRISPVLNDLHQIRLYSDTDGWTTRPVLHVDTGMTRLGLSVADLRQALKVFPELPSVIGAVISHLACGDEEAHHKNAEQLQRFLAARRLLPGVPASLANSAGVFLPASYHFDFARAGCALYGINPGHGPTRMRPVVTLSAPIIQVRTLERQETIGYGATAAAEKGARIAIAALGYADGWGRQLGNASHAYVLGRKVAVVGRISMDMTALDISKLNISEAALHLRAEFINSEQTVDMVADDGQTIGYEVLSRLGPRVRRIYD